MNIIDDIFELFECIWINILQYKYLDYTIDVFELIYHTTWECFGVKAETPLVEGGGIGHCSLDNIYENWRVSEN